MKVALAAFGAALVLSSAVGVASAGRLSISNRSFRATWAPLKYQGVEINVDCNVTIEGSFHSSTITKVAGTLVGYARPIQWNLVREGGGAIASVEEPATQIPLKEGGAGCPAEITFTGNGRIALLGTTTAINGEANIDSRSRRAVAARRAVPSASPQSVAWVCSMRRGSVGGAVRRVVAELHRRQRPGEHAGEVEHQESGEGGG